jgi:hypothetical protein
LSEDKPKKKGHSVSLGKVISIALVMLLVGLAVGGILGVTVIQPELQKLHIGFGNQGDQNTGDQNNNNNNGNQNSAPTTNSPNNNDNNYNNNPTSSDTNNNNQNNNQNQMANNNAPISNPTGNYGGSGQFNIITTQNGNTYSGTISANINCPVQQNGNTISLNLQVTPTNVPNSLQQVVSIGNSVTFNFAGTTSGTQFNANAQGNTGGNGPTFDLNISGSIEQNQLIFTLTSASDSQITISTPQQITLYPS